jgi:putative hydrolase of the HAD superfamily
MSEATAVLIDVGGVLVVPPRAALVGTLESNGMTTVDDGDPERFHYDGVRHVDGHPPVADGDHILTYTSGVAMGLGVAVGDVERASLLLAEQLDGMPWSQVLGGARTGLRALADAGVPVGVVSNSDGTVERQLLDTELCQVGEGAGVPVAIVVDSHVVGVTKPDPAIFHFALDAMGVDAAECLYVGDTVTYDVTGARAAGLRPVHLDPYRFCPQPDDHLHVTHLAHLAAMLDA